MSKDVWLKVAELPRNIRYGRIAKLNEREFVLVPEFADDVDIESKEYGVYKFNIHSNNWAGFIEYAANFEISKATTIFDAKNNKLIIHGIDESEDELEGVFMIDINTHKYDKLIEYKAGGGLGCCSVDGDIHMIGGWKARKHMIIKEGKNQVEQIHEFLDISNIYGPGVFALRSIQSILLIGGFSDFKEPVNIRLFSLETKKWINIPDIIKFNKLFNISGCVTRNEKHIILKGDAIYSNDEKIQQTIYILDIGDNEGNGYRLRESKVEFPEKNGQIVITGDKDKDERMVFGYIRQLFVKEEFVKSEMVEPSMDIIRLIYTFYASEMLHFVGVDRNANGMVVHYSIDLKCIL